MDSLQLSQLVPLVFLALVVLIVVSLPKPPSFWRYLDDALRRLDEELRGSGINRRLLRLPVFSAETVRRNEAQFVRERLPRKSPRTRYLLALLVVGVVVWWLTR